MVREVKFSCDELDGIELPVARDRFDDVDDEFADGFPEHGRERRRTSRERAARGRAGSPDSSRRHLAGADWIDSVPVPRRRDERASV
jgi:hypothetical protein